MRHDLVKGRPPGRIEVQDFGDEILGCVGDEDVLRELVGVKSNFLVSGFHVGGFEGRLADEHGVDDDT